MFLPRFSQHQATEFFSNMSFMNMFLHNGGQPYANRYYFDDPMSGCDTVTGVIEGN